MKRRIALWLALAFVLSMIPATAFARTVREVCDACHGMKGEPCVSCEGTGKMKCDRCGGTGTGTFPFIYCLDCSGTGTIACLACNGDGRETCGVCGGTGYHEFEVEDDDEEDSVKKSDKTERKRPAIERINKKRVGVGIHIEKPQKKDEREKHDVLWKNFSKKRPELNRKSISQKEEIRIRKTSPKKSSVNTKKNKSACSKRR